MMNIKSILLTCSVLTLCTVQAKAQTNTFLSSGDAGIGTDDPQADLAVNGDILAKQIKVKTDITVPDYVFEPGYKMNTLEQIEEFVKTHKHLPEIPSAKEIAADGLDLAKMNLLLLKKMEEMTLQMIQMNKTLAKQTEELKQLKENRSMAR